MMSYGFMLMICHDLRGFLETAQRRLDFVERILERVAFTGVCEEHEALAATVWLEYS
jgi:hypothetical protein